METLKGEPGQNYYTLNGRWYVADEAGLIQVTDPNDAFELMRHGCRPLPMGTPLPSASEVRSKNRGGRPVEHDWDGFWIEVVRISEASPDGLPSRDELRERMFKFVEGWRKQPDDAIRAKLRRLYTALDRDE